MITIEETCYGDNTCFVCSQPYKHMRFWQMDKDVGLFEMKIYVAHPSCLKLVQKIKQKQQETVNLEYELFCKRFPDLNDF